MKTRTIHIYSFAELSEEAKEKARNWWRNGFEYAWHDESLASVKAFCEHFGVKLKEWSIGAYCPFEYSTDAENRNFRGIKLRDIDREFTPTGYCLDNCLWYAFYDEFKKTGDAKHAFNDALHAGFKAWQDDIEYQLSDEAADEAISINDYEFFETGARAW